MTCDIKHFYPPWLLDNFHLYANGLVRNLQAFSNSNKKFTHVPAAGDCNQGFTTSSTGSIIHVTPNSSLGVKLYVEDSNGDKHYLRINTVQNNAVELVCQSYVDSVSWNFNCYEDGLKYFPVVCKQIIMSSHTDCIYYTQVAQHPYYRQEMEFDVVTVRIDDLL